MGDEWLYAMESRLRLRRSPPQAGLESGTARSADHRLTELPGLLTGETARYRLKHCPKQPTICFSARNRIASRKPISSLKSKLDERDYYISVYDKVNDKIDCSVPVGHINS